MSVEVIGLNDFIVNLDIAKDETKPLVERAALELALDIKRKAQGKAPVRTAELAQSINAMPIDYGAETTVGAKYGIYVEEGTGLFDPYGPHLIYPKTAKAMVWEDDGHTYGARWTRGMEAQPYFWPAVREVDVSGKMAEVADELIRTATR